MRTRVTPVPRRRPVKLAGEILTLHDLSGARFVFGTGMGAGASEFDCLGEETDRPTRGRMLDETLEVLQAIFGGDAIGHHGDHYTLVAEALLRWSIQGRGSSRSAVGVRSDRFGEFIEGCRHT